MAFRRSVAVRWLSPQCGISQRAPASLLAALPWGLDPAPLPSAPFSLPSVAKQGHGFGVRIPQGRPPSRARSSLPSPRWGGLFLGCFAIRAKGGLHQTPAPLGGRGRERRRSERGEGVFGRRMSGAGCRMLVSWLSAISPKGGVRWAGCRLAGFVGWFGGWRLSVQKAAFGGQVVGRRMSGAVVSLAGWV